MRIMRYYRRSSFTCELPVTIRHSATVLNRNISTWKYSKTVHYQGLANNAHAKITEKYSSAASHCMVCLHISRQTIGYHDNFVETSCKFIIIAVINLRSVCKNFKLNSKGKVLIENFVELNFVS